MKILFNSSVGLGDSAYLYMVLRALKRARPDILMDVLAWPGPFKLFLLSGVTNLVIDAGKQIDKYSARGLADFDLFKARAGDLQGYDIIYNLQHHRASAYMCHLAEPGRLVGVDPDKDTDGWYNDIHTTAPGEHILDSLVRLLLETLDLERLPLEAQMVLPEDATLPVRQLIAELDGNPGPLVGIHPGAAGTERLWPYRYWGELVQCLLEGDKARIILFGSDLRHQGEQPVLDKPLVDIIQRLSGDRCLDLSGQLNVATLALIIGQLDLYVGLDTGPTHLAELLGTPTVALFRLFSEDLLNRWRPRGENVSLLVHEDLARISPDQVLVNSRKLLATQPPGVNVV
ncbi:glycosyltransferase family 9 protein [candidate division KSB1 bacterium]